MGGILTKMSEEELSDMKNFEENIKYFDEVVAVNPQYAGKFVVVDDKKVVGVYDDEKSYMKALENLSKIRTHKSAYTSYVFGDKMRLCLIGERSIANI